MGETIRIKDLPEKQSLSSDDLFLNSDAVTTSKVTSRQIADYVAHSDEIGNVAVKKEEVGQPLGVAPLDLNGKIDGTYITYGTEEFTAFRGSEGEKLKENKVDKIEGKGLSSNDFTDEEKSKLDGIEAGATRYTHPATHPADMIQQDADHRFVTDTEKDNWNDTLATANNYSDINYQQATGYTDAKIAALINGAPTTLDTLKEIADAMVENQNVVKALEEAIGNKSNESEFDSHVKDKSNPHNVTKGQVGLGNVNNTSDANKPVSAAQQAALDNKVSKSGDIMSGELRIESADPSNFYVKRTDTDTEIHMGVGSGGINHGIYSDKLNKWIAYADDSSIYLNGNASTANQWKTERNINGMCINGSGNRVNYGTCSTAAATTAKTVTCSGFALVTGAEITVKFTTTNTASNPTLNVNNTGAKPIYYRGSAIATDYLAANRTYTFRYNGTQYELVGDINVTKLYNYSLADCPGGDALNPTEWDNVELLTSTMPFYVWFHNIGKMVKNIRYLYQNSVKMYMKVFASATLTFSGNTYSMDTSSSDKAEFVQQVVANKSRIIHITGYEGYGTQGNAHELLLQTISSADNGITLYCPYANAKISSILMLYY